MRNTVGLFISANAVREFQQRVPHVYAPNEIFCLWFDDVYMPEDHNFIAAFTSSELIEIKLFNAVLEKLSIEAGDPAPDLELLFKLPSWQEVNQQAEVLLKALPFNLC